MKDSFFEMLLNLFEQSLAQLKKSRMSEDDADVSAVEPQATLATESVKHAKSTSMRVFTYDEQIKLTKASYQFIMRLLSWKIIHPEIMELILSQLLFSKSSFVTLDETKWTIRNALMENLSVEQLAFLDLVLYQKEDGFQLQ
jgi:uncharacterized protein Smg (DUF494 family)